MKKNRLKALNCVLVDNKIYFVALELNIIYSLNMDTYEIEFMEELPKEPMIKDKLYGNICYCCEKIVLAPLNAEKIWIYDLQHKKWSGIELFEEERRIPYKFFGIVPYNNYVYMFGHYYPGIIRLDINTFSIERIELVDERIDLDNKKRDGFFNLNFVRRGGWLYTPVLQTNQIMKLELETGKYKLIPVGSNENQYVGIAWDGEYYWLPPRKNGPYVKWDGNQGNIEYNLPEEFSKEQYYFSSSFLVDNKLVFCGFAGKTIEFKIDKPQNISIQNRNIVFYKKIDDITYILQEDNGNLFVHRTGEEEQQIHYVYNIDKLQAILDNNLFGTEEFEFSSIINENSVISLEIFTNYIAEK